MRNWNVSRKRYKGAQDGSTFDPRFRRVVDRLFSGGTRSLPYSGVPTLLAAPYLPEAARHSRHRWPAGRDDRRADGSRRHQSQLARASVRVRCAPSSASGLTTTRSIACRPYDLRVADIGDVPFRSRFSLESCHEDIEEYFKKIVDAGVAPLSVGGDHSITQPILRALGRKQPVGLIHIDAHCDTGGEFDGSKFHHGGPFRNAVLDGVLDPHRTMQIGIRGSSEYLWEFSYDTGMTVIHSQEFAKHGLPGGDREGARSRRRRAGVRHVRHRRAGSGVCAGHRHAGNRRPDDARSAAVPERPEGLNVVGGDVVEVAPQYDSTTNTAQAGAQMLFEILSLMVFSPSIGRRPA